MRAACILTRSLEPCRDCKQIERYDADMADGKLSPQPLPARGGEAREAVYLLDQENVAGLSIG
jgi:hypothetical protein